MIATAVAHGDALQLTPCPPSLVLDLAAAIWGSQRHHHIWIRQPIPPVVAYQVLGADHPHLQQRPAGATGFRTGTAERLLDRQMGAANQAHTKTMQQSRRGGCLRLPGGSGSPAHRSHGVVMPPPPPPAAAGRRLKRRSGRGRCQRTAAGCRRVPSVAAAAPPPRPPCCAAPLLRCGADCCQVVPLALLMVLSDGALLCEGPEGRDRAAAEQRGVLPLGRQRQPAAVAAAGGRAKGRPCRGRWRLPRIALQPPPTL